MLTDILKKEHQIIMEALHAVRQFGIGSKEGQVSLFAVKQKLLAHLQKEDSEFYPFLKEEAKVDPEFPTANVPAPLAVHVRRRGLPSHSVEHARQGPGATGLDPRRCSVRAHEPEEDHRAGSAS